MTNEIKPEKLLYIQTLQGFREKALPQLIDYIKNFGGFTVEITEDDNNCDEMKAITFRNPDYEDTNFRLSEEFLSGLIFFANSIHHTMELNFETIEVQRGQVITVVAIELRPKHHSEVF